MIRILFSSEHVINAKFVVDLRQHKFSIMNSQQQAVGIVRLAKKDLCTLGPVNIYSSLVYSMAIGGKTI